MALPASGPISLNDVNIELAIPPLTTISLGDATVRALFNVDTGPISMSDGYGKSNITDYLVTIEENIDAQQGTDLRAFAISRGWDGVEALRVVLESGYRITTASNGNYNNNYTALSIDGSFPNGVIFENYGTVAGGGGRGGQGAYNYLQSNKQGTYTVVRAASLGFNGIRALLTNVPVTIFNYGTIAGGGGGGGGGGLASGYDPADVNAVTSSTGGAGGGGGGPNNGLGATGAGGVPAATWSQPGGKIWTRPASPDGFDSSLQFGGAGRGGVIGAAPQLVGINGGNSGAGGDWGQSGSSGAFGTNTYSEYSPTAGALGGAAGEAVVGNAYITWGATGTRLGPIVS